MSTRERRIVVIGQRREEIDLRALADLIGAAAEGDPVSHGENDVVSEPWQIQRTPAPGKGGPEKIAQRRT